MYNVSSSSDDNLASSQPDLDFNCPFKLVQSEITFLDVCTAVVNIVSAIPAVLGNILILLAIYKTSSIASPSKVLLASLAFTDLGIGLFVQPLYLAKTLSSDKQRKCFIGLLFDILSGHLSITSFFSMMFISVDKFLALHLKLRYKTVVTRNRSIFLVLLVRGVALPWAISYVLYTKLYFLLIILIMPWCLIISSLAFIKIHLVLRRQRRNFQNQTQTESSRRANALKISKFKKSVNSMFFVFCALLIAYAPSWAVILVRTVHGTTEILEDVTKVTMTVVLTNSTVNPILYLWRMDELRASAKEVLAGIVPKSLRQKVSGNAIEHFELTVN